MIKVATYLTLSSAYTAEYFLATRADVEDRSVLELHKDMLEHFKQKYTQLGASNELVVAWRRKLLNSYIEQLTGLVTELAAVA